MRKKRIAQLCMLVVITGSILPIFGFLSTAHLASQQASKDQDKIDASKLFNHNCAKCHGKDGRAKTFRGKLVGARNLTDAKWQASVTDEQIKEAIKKGPEEMPSFEKKLSPAEIDSLVGYVRHFKQEPRGTKKK